SSRRHTRSARDWSSDVCSSDLLDTGMHLVFINRKLGREQVRYPHPALEEILKPTYGVITYQEQVMRIANVLAGFSLAEADVLRRSEERRVGKGGAHRGSRGQRR